MPKSVRCGRQFFIDQAKQFAATQKHPQQAFDSFLSGVSCVLKELDGKTVVMDRQRSSGDFVNRGTITKDFSWSMRDIQFSKNAKPTNL